MGEVSDRLSAALSGRYALEREIGAGGMATVYLAQDLKHHRRVALKVLRPELAAMVGAERFLAEIETTANLQHPHILPLFDSGQADGLVFYVMPYVEGESLQARLARQTQLPVDEAVRIAADVADALDYAHRHGVIHRDIKPANILLHEGRPLVADFGIALAVSTAGSGRLTETGLSLGTPHYMSPEQASGERAVDSRSDIYALGCVLYEMLAGEPPHVGATAQAVLAKILTEEPKRLRESRRAVPPHIDAVVARALERLPADRFVAAAEFTAATRDRAFRHGEGSEVANPVVARPRLWLIGTTVASLVIAGIAIMRRPAEAGPAVYDAGLPDEAPFLLRRGGGFGVSPAADFVVYPAETPAGVELWKRSLRDDAAQPVSGTAGAGAPVISPDGTRVAFTASGHLRVVRIAGGEPRDLGELIGGSWSPRWISDSQILLADGDRRILRWFDVESGPIRQFPLPTNCSLPQLLPDNERVVCTVYYYPIVFRVSDGSREYLKAEGVGVERAPLRGSHFTLVDGRYLVYMSMTGELRAVPFDPETLTIGRSVGLVRGVSRTPLFGRGEFSISSSGSLVYAVGPNAEVGQLVRADGTAPAQPVIPQPAAYLRFDITRDGRRLAAVVEGESEQELRVIDLATGQSRTWITGLVFSEPFWNAAGDSLLIGLRQLGPDGRDREVILWGRPDSPLPPDTVAVGFHFFATSWLADGRVIGNGGDRLISIDLSRRPAPIDTLPLPDLFFNAVSPDGEWLAYMPSDLSAVMLTPFPRMDRQIQVTRGGDDPQWLSSSDLTFQTAAGTFSRVNVDATRDPLVTAPRLWFQDPRMASTPGQSYTTLEDGSVIYVQGPDRNTASYLRVIPGWVEQMKRAVDEANR